MHLLTHTFPTPEENLACDEALLNLCEEGLTGEVLRFWESQQYFVVLGSSNRLADEVHEPACRKANVPFLRRHSGGGTVLQGPGCLNFSLILNIDPAGPTRNITETTRFIMQRHAAALSDLLGETVEMKGSSDLTIAGRKFSGNAQRRRLRALLFHGTFLMDFDLELIAEYLRMPPRQPDYRKHRGHLDFVRNIGARRDILIKLLSETWHASSPFILTPDAQIKELVDSKYSRPEWNYKL